MTPMTSQDKGGSENRMYNGVRWLSNPQVQLQASQVRVAANPQPIIARQLQRPLDCWSMRKP
jgi:hypothetical protein